MNSEKVMNNTFEDLKEVLSKYNHKDSIDILLIKKRMNEILDVYDAKREFYKHLPEITTANYDINTHTINAYIKTDADKVIIINIKEIN